MNTQNKDRQSSSDSGYQQNDQKKQQQKQSFDEGVKNDSDNQPTNKPAGNDPEIETPVHNPEKTERKIPEMKENQK